MWVGVFWGLVANIFWGASYLIPLFAPDYGPTYLTIGRGFFMGLTSLVLIIFSFQRYTQLTRSDWLYATKISVVGNFLQGGFVFASVLYAGVPVAGMCFGAVPVAVALISNWRDKRRGKPFVTLKKLMIPLTCIFVGFIVSNITELETSITEGGRTMGEFFFGLACGLISTVMWTWYPIKNADWLQAHPQTSSAIWTTAQCLVLLPIATILYPVVALTDESMTSFFGPTPVTLLGAAVFGGVICSFVAGIFWNICSKKCPTALVGQMLVFETIFSVLFGHLYRMQFPTPTLCAGFLLLLFGISYSLKLFNDATARHGEPLEFKKETKKAKKA